MEQADGEQERLRAALPEKVGGPSDGACVTVVGITDRQRAPVQLVAERRHASQRVSGRRPGRADSGVGRPGAVPRVVEPQVKVLVPQVGRIEPCRVVKDLAAAGDMVASLPECLRQRDSLRHVRSPPVAVVVNACRRRGQAEQQRRARRVALGRGGICLAKQHSASRQPVDVGSARVRMGGQRPDPVIEVVGEDQQDVGPCSFGRAAGECG